MESNRCHWPFNTPGSTGARDGAISGFSEEVPARNPAAKSLRWRLGFCPNYHATLFSESFLFLRNSEWPRDAIFCVIITIAKAVNISNPFICRAGKVSHSCSSGSSLMARSLLGPCALPSWGHTWSSFQNPEQSLTRFSPLQGIFPVLFAVAQTPQLI